MSHATPGLLSVSEMPFESPIVSQLVGEMNAERKARTPRFTPSGGSTVEASDFLAPIGVFLVAMVDGQAAGCGGLRRLAPEVGEIKRLFVSPRARGQGIGRALLGALEDRARSLGYRAVRLDTDGGEPAALALFRARGYSEIGDYNANEYASHWFELELSRA